MKVIWMQTCLDCVTNSRARTLEKRRELGVPEPEV